MIIEWETVTQVFARVDHEAARLTMCLALTPTGCGQAFHAFAVILPTDALRDGIDLTDRVCVAQHVDRDEAQKAAHDHAVRWCAELDARIAANDQPAIPVPRAN